MAFQKYKEYIKIVFTSRNFSGNLKHKPFLLGITETKQMMTIHDYSENKPSMI